MSIRSDADSIIHAAIQAVLPDAAMKKVLNEINLAGNVHLIAVGKAAWQMASTACLVLGNRIQGGIVITKYGHAQGDLPYVRIFEAGHPVPDENSFIATKAVLEHVKDLTANDTVLFLLSGGGSALFELPLIPKEELASINTQLLSCGADIVEINTIRKRLSRVKGGRFAQSCEPAKVVSIVLSDIIGDPLDMIASGPAHQDHSTCGQALAIVKKYDLNLSNRALQLSASETPQLREDIETHVIGSVRKLCLAAGEACRRLGYEPFILTASLRCNARDAGSFLASIGEFHSDSKESMAFIVGGETIVEVMGDGLGGRNQGIALAAAVGISGLDHVAVFSIGSDGADGPTDAAGGYVDGSTKRKLEKMGIDIFDVLARNDSYHALERCDGLIKTGATGTNVNDVSILLIKR